MTVPSADTPPPMRKGRLIAATLGALAVAALIVLGAILPAEYNRDPLGLGRLTGISRLWAPDEATVDVRGGSGPAAREYAIPYRQDVVEIPLGGFMTGADNSELEWKVRMPQGATLTYAWEAVGAERPDDVYFDQHGHTTPTQENVGMTVAKYREGSGLRQQGAVTAPFDGIHGWFFQNNGERPVVIRLRVSGFYELIPAGRPGNEAGVVPNVPAAQARPNAPLALKSAP